MKRSRFLRKSGEISKKISGNFKKQKNKCKNPDPLKCRQTVKQLEKPPENFKKSKETLEKQKSIQCLEQTGCFKKFWIYLKKIQKNLCKTETNKKGWREHFKKP